MTWAQTFTGQAFDFVGLLAGEPQPIEMRDIAHHLSHLCRYAGATAYFYPVAQHSILVSRVAVELAKREGASFRVIAAVARWGLMHDAHETWTCDVLGPLKALIAQHTNVLARIEAAADMQIRRVFALDFDEEIAGYVHRADMAMLAHERAALLGPSPREWRIGNDPEVEAVAIEPWTVARARRHFLDAAGSLGIVADLTDSPPH